MTEQEEEQKQWEVSKALSSTVWRPKELRARAGQEAKRAEVDLKW